MKIKKGIGLALLVASASVLAWVWYVNSYKANMPVIFSTRDMLTSLYRAYKNEYWDSSTGKTIDRQHGNITTSEGQSYTMLRAVWQDDRPTFDKTWAWTEANLQRPDHLFSWAWGKQPGGLEGILTGVGGYNSASDADSDIAVSLIFANARWQDPKYLDAARQVASSIWQNEVVDVAGKPVLVSNNVEKNSTRYVLVNPSYFSPYAYRMFAQIDPSHPWGSLIDNTYSVADRALSAGLDKSRGDLPPDWLLMDKTDGSMLPATRNASNLTSNYSYDAMRTPWRFAMDWFWYGDPRAKSLLSKMSFLKTEWDSHGAIYTTYSHDGQAIIDQEAPAIYGGDLGYFLVEDPSAAKQIYDVKLTTLFDPDNMTWRKKLSYYDDNWAWFGLALYTDSLSNLAAEANKVNIGEAAPSNKTNQNL